jgi:hypothetical protein
MTLLRLQAPFVIWTLQRTGGTNFNNCLNHLSDCPRLQDEAFNPGRAQGHLTEAWKRTKDEAALRRDIGDICTQHHNFKHCVELVPWPVNEVLTDTTVTHGYSHIFLYRRNPLQRILSREYARRTATWGPRQARAAAGKDISSAMETPLDAEAAIRHETMANNRLNRVWAALTAAGATPIPISFEELYATDETVTRQSLERVFSGLGQTLSADQTTEIMDMVRTRGDQKTRDRYSQFKGVGRLEERLVELPSLLCST